MAWTPPISDGIEVPKWELSKFPKLKEASP